jgi:hypothetical protein
VKAQRAAPPSNHWQSNVLVSYFTGISAVIRDNPVACEFSCGNQTSTDGKKRN